MLWPLKYQPLILLWLGLGFFYLDQGWGEEITRVTLCDGLIQGLSRGERKLDLGTNDRNLLCGKKGEISAWQHIPSNQQAFFLKGILQNQGHHHPTFRYDGSDLVFQLGPPTLIENYEVTVAPDFPLPFERFRHLHDRVLTPSLLDYIENQIRSYFLNRGFACVQVSTDAVVAAKTVHIHVDLG